jgi:protein-S-isoprenylcysteine O-methyltransferase Ste14
VADLAAIYRDKSPSLGTKATLALIHLGVVLLVLWLLFGGGIATVDRTVGVEYRSASEIRRIVLATAAVLYFLRTFGTLFVFLRRRMPWTEVWTIAVWVGTIDVLFAYFGGRNEMPFGGLGAAGICLVLVGSYLNTGAELQRHAWKRQPDNKGHLFTGGLFRYARHINYFGDVVLFTGWVLITEFLPLLTVPALMIGGFIFLNIPAQDRYLAERYGEEYRSYAARTARLMPYIY